MSGPIIPLPWLNAHPDAQVVLEEMRDDAALEFMEYPRRYGLLLAPDRENFILRVGILQGANLITCAQAAALVRGLGVSILNPDEEGHGNL